MLIAQRIIVLWLILLGMVFLTACGGGAAEPPPAATSAPEPAQASTSAPEPTQAPTSAPTPTPVPEPTATAGPSGEKVSFEFVKSLSTAEQVDDIENLLHDTEGILSIRGDEIGLTLTYDPEIITVDDLRQQMSIIGFPVKP